MKKTIYLIISTLALACCLFSSCSKVYEEKWDSIYYTDQYGDKVCRLYTSYKLSNDSTNSYTDFPFSLPIAIYYSGSWKAELTSECDWGFIDKTSGEGVHYIHFTYLQNNTGALRYVILRITCDNGETADITLSQDTL